jgi:hypothetical protein
MRLCKDCKHFMPNSLGHKYAKCLLTEKIDVVSGEKTYGYCDVIGRAWGRFCGPEGRFWEQKECQNLTQISPSSNASSGENSCTTENGPTENTKSAPSLGSRVFQDVRSVFTFFWPTALATVGFLFWLWLFGKLVPPR